MVDIKRNIPFVLLISLCLLILSPNIVFSSKELVFDEANLFTKGEIETLDQKTNELSDEFNMDIVIVTTNNAQGKSSREFADDYFDYGGFGRGNDYDGILFLIDMDNREAYISTSGRGIRYLTDQRIERVLDAVFDNGLSRGDYFGAAMGFINQTEAFLDAGIPAGQYNEPEGPRQKKLTPTEIILSLIGGATAGGAFYIGNKSRYRTKRQRSPYSYKANSIINFNSVNDKLIDTFVTHRIIPKNNNISSGGSSSGRSTTHRSSSGRSHGGGGRKF